eukprot:9350330-Alexandrium_andersonii.AAC.1
MSSGGNEGVLWVPRPSGAHEARERRAANSGDGEGALCDSSPSKAQERSGAYPSDTEGVLRGRSPLEACERGAANFGDVR